MEQYQIRVVYKSGYVHDFWVTSFSFEKKPEGLTLAWEAASPSTQPLFIGVDDVAAIWQIGKREVPNAANDV